VRDYYEIFNPTVQSGGRDSVISIATCYVLDGLEIETHWGWYSPCPSRKDPEAHPASSAMASGSVQVVKRPRRGADHLPHSSTEVAKWLEVCLSLLTVPA